MTTLRVLIDERPDPARGAPWSLFDDAGRILRRGIDVPAAWPEAGRTEAVVAARHGRLVALDLPLLAPARAEAAARYALEDRLAGPLEEHHVALGSRRHDEALPVAIVANEWTRAFAQASRQCGLHWARVILESDLALAPENGWCWCAVSIRSSGFIRTYDGTTVAVGPVQDDDALPDELVMAISRAVPRAPRCVRVDTGDFTQEWLEHAREQSGIQFERGKPWDWAEAGEVAFLRAIDLFSGRYGVPADVLSTDGARLLRPAAWVGAAAIALFASALIGNWLWLRWETLQLDRDLELVAQRAAPQVAIGTPPAIAVARQLAVARHRVGLPSSDDFLPLLARSAPVLAVLPPGSIRSISYADGHIVLELQKVDTNQTARLQSEMRNQGLIAVAAPSAGGARLRVGVH